MSQPNILLITTDQQRFDTIQALGNQSIFTPHLDWLVDQGITYSRCYSDSPICMPARATIMTGRYGYMNGLIGNVRDARPMAEYPTLPGILTSAGYQTRAQGKMHFEPLRCNYGFEHMEILPDYYRYMEKHPEKGVPMDHGVGQNEMTPVISTVSDTDSLTHWTVDRSIDFLETRDESRPFFLWTSFAKPHPPFDPVREYWELYDGIDLPPEVIGDWSSRVEDIPAGFMSPTYHLNNFHRFGEQARRAAKRAYYACISQIDYNLGLLLARMREMGLFANTWIIFTSDHGEMLGDHRMGAKSSFFEGSGHVPLLIRPPDGENFDSLRGARCDALTCLADILPTCLGVTGVDFPNGVDIQGIDLLAQYRGDDRRDHLIGRSSGFHAVISGSKKYHFAEEGGGQLLFDLSNDPMEQRELIRTGEHDADLEELRTLLVKQLTSEHDQLVKDGTLKAVKPARTAQEVRASIWPGFHSRLVPTDVIH